MSTTSQSYNSGTQKKERKYSVAVEEYVPIKLLKSNHTYEQLFMVVDAQNKKYTNGKQYCQFTLKDVTGEITGRIWGGKVKSFVFPKFCYLTIDLYHWNNKQYFSTTAKNEL